MERFYGIANPFVQRVRDLAADYNVDAEQQVIPDAAILRLAAQRIYSDKVNLLEVAIDYVRAARYRSVDQTPERARAAKARVDYLLGILMSPAAADYVVDSSLVVLPPPTAAGPGRGRRDGQRNQHSESHCRLSDCL